MRCTVVITILAREVGTTSRLNTIRSITVRDFVEVETKDLVLAIELIDLNRENKLFNLTRNALAVGQ